MSSRNMADMSLPLLIISECVFSFHELHKAKKSLILGTPEPYQSYDDSRDESAKG